MYSPIKLPINEAVALVWSGSLPPSPGNSPHDGEITDLSE